MALLMISSVALTAGAAEQSLSQSPMEANQSAVGGEAGQLQLPQNSVINSRPIALSTLDDAAQTFISFYNDLLPVSTPKDASDICRALGTDDFIPRCEAALNKRIQLLKSLSGLTGAQFPEGKITVNEDLENAVDVKWKEMLIFGKMAQNHDHHIRIFYSKITDHWKVRQLDEFR